MLTNQRIHSTQAMGNRRGAIIPMFAITLPVLLILCAIAINFCQMKLTQTELQVATDAAARAGARGWSETQSVDEAKAFAQLAAFANNVNGTPLVLSASESDSQIVFGASLQQTDARYQFIPVSESQIAAGAFTSGVQVNASKNIPLIFQVGGRDQFLPRATSIASQTDRDIALVLDRSGSMNFPIASTPAPDGAPPLSTRWEALLAANGEFLDLLRGTRQRELVAVTWFATGAENLVPLTDNMDQCEQAIDSLVPDGATSLGDGLLRAVDSLSGLGSRSNALKTIIVFTDGLSNNGTPPDDAVVEIVANFPDYVVHAITFSDEADQRTMQNLADLTGGIHIHADTGTELIEAFREIAFTLRTIVTD